MTFYTCLDNKGDVIARCQTKEDVAVLQRMGRPIAEVKAMRNEEAVVCSLTAAPPISTRTIKPSLDFTRWLTQSS
jgi:hypothetical protein